MPKNPESFQQQAGEVFREADQEMDNQYYEKLEVELNEFSAELDGRVKAVCEEAYRARYEKCLKEEKVNIFEGSEDLMPSAEAGAGEAEAEAAEAPKKRGRKK